MFIFTLFSVFVMVPDLKHFKSDIEIEIILIVFLFEPERRNHIASFLMIF